MRNVIKAFPQFIFRAWHGRKIAENIRLLKFSAPSRISRVKSIIILALFCGLVAFAGAAEVYHTNRTFTAVGIDVKGTPPLVDMLYTESGKLTDLVKGTNITINTNETCAIEKQAAIPICYGSAEEAWNAAVAYNGSESNYPGKTFDNVGWVRGTKSVNGDWGAHLWVIQNQIAFQSSTSAWWTTNGVSVAITNVMVGSLGNYQPMENVVTNVPPMSMATNDFPGDNQSDEGIYRVDITNVFYELAVLKVEMTFADPDDSNWGDLAEKKVILSDKESRIKLKITPQLSDLQTIFNALGTKLKIKTSGTAPNGQDFTLTSQNTTLVQGSGYSELRAALTRNQLISLGVLPNEENDSVTEKAWYDTGDANYDATSNLRDGEAFESSMTAASRGRCARVGDLNSSPPNSPLDASFFKAAGVEIITAEYGGAASVKRQVMNQADYFYYSGHGWHASGLTAAGGSSDVSGYWNKDMDVVIIAGCSVLDINDYNNNFTNPVEHVRSPGKEWEPLGPAVLLGYNYEAPNDLQNSDAIISSWCANRGSLGDVKAWVDVNNNPNGRNACAIEAGVSYTYIYFSYVFPLGYRSKEVPKSGW